MRGLARYLDYGNQYRCQEASICLYKNYEYLSKELWQAVYLRKCFREQSVYLDLTIDYSYSKPALQATSILMRDLAAC